MAGGVCLAGLEGGGVSRHVGRVADVLGLLGKEATFTTAILTSLGCRGGELVLLVRAFVHTAEETDSRK